MGPNPTPASIAVVRVLNKYQDPVPRHVQAATLTDESRLPSNQWTEETGQVRSVFGRERNPARFQLGQQRPLTASGKNDWFAAGAVVRSRAVNGGSTANRGHSAGPALQRLDDRLLDDRPPATES